MKCFYSKLCPLVDCVLFHGLEYPWKCFHRVMFTIQSSTFKNSSIITLWHQYLFGVDVFGIFPFFFLCCPTYIINGMASYIRRRAWWLVLIKTCLLMFMLFLCTLIGRRYVYNGLWSTFEWWKRRRVLIYPKCCGGNTMSTSAYM